MVGTTSENTTESSSVDQSRWIEQPSSTGRQFVDTDGRRLEVLPQTGGDWAADMFHQYGCTRLILAPSEDHVLAQLVEIGELQPSDF